VLKRVVHTVNNGLYGDNKGKASKWLGTRSSRVVILLVNDELRPSELKGSVVSA
jgi:hypothetical protein